MTSRDQIHKRLNKPEQDERLFNNFKMPKPDLSKTCDFGKLKSRNLDYTLHHLNGRICFIFRHLS